MAKITIDIKDGTKEKAFINFLKEIPFITIENNKQRVLKAPINFKKLYGIWKGRDIDLSKLREKAWDRF